MLSVLANSVLMFTKVAENAFRQFGCITEPLHAKNSWYAMLLNADNKEVVTMCYGNFLASF
jgi:hypothetical protein